MKPRREFVRVPGNPTVIASRAAARLAYLGDQVTPLSEASFIWTPQPAERILFRCPDSVVVTALPADEQGHANISFEWQPPAVDMVKPVGFLAAIAGALAGALQGAPPWAWLAAAIPGLVLAATPIVMDSGWLGRLTHAAAAGRSRGLEKVPEAEQWLSLEPEEQALVIELLHLAAEELRKSGELCDLAYRGTNLKSEETRDGWPLWHRAYGKDPVTDRARLARGWKAYGQIALGRVAFGHAAKGWLAIGQAAAGLVAIGQAAVGLVAALGQLGVSALVSAAQIAVGLVAAGQMAVGLISVDSGLPRGGTVVVFLVTAGILGGIAALALKIRSLTFSGLNRKEAEQQLEEHRQWQPIPDEMSLSPAERMSGEQERGISLVERSADERTGGL